MRREFERVVATVKGGVAILAFNHPEVRNALSAGMIAGAGEALDFIEADGARALILTGEGSAFCSGANLAERPVGADSSERVGRSLDTVYHPILRRLRDFPFPLVTAVNGPAAGIGMSFALMGDLIVAARSAYFSLAFSRIGLVPDGGATWVLPRLIGLARARELALLGEKLTAEKALEWGLVNRVADDEALMDTAFALARQMAEGPAALGLIRRLFRESPDNSYEEQLALERECQMRAAGTQDFREGVSAFRAKREPVFKGK